MKKKGEGKESATNTHMIKIHVIIFQLESDHPLGNFNVSLNDA